MSRRPVAFLILSLGVAACGVVFWGCAQGSPMLYRLRAPSANAVAGGSARPSPGLLAPDSGRAASALRSALAMAAPGEEIWVIQKAEPSATPADKDAPRCGELRTHVEGKADVAIPLKHTNVSAAIAGYISTVDVVQQFHNPYDEKIEAVYVFPLPVNAAVQDFLMTIGERRIRGIIREKEEAKRIYAEARQQGYVAALMTQERPNIFTQSVANIEPNHDIDIQIRYFHTLAYDDGWYEFVFPMVIGPRFNPPGFAGGVGAVDRGRTGASGQSTEIQYLKPGERTAHAIDVEVDLDAGVSIEQLRSVNHKIAVTRPDERRAVVRLDPGDSLPNKDFVLRYKVAGDRLKTGFLAHRDSRGGFFTLMVYPPDGLGDLPRGPMEMIFVLDCSGSMAGQPLAQAKVAVQQALDKMRPEDTFQIIRFSNNASQLGPTPLPATPENIKKGRSYLRSLDGDGGTMMIEGIRAALDFPHDEDRLRTVAFLTDGFIGNESEIFTAVGERLGASRIFSFGVGSSSNRYLLDGLARMGRGAVAYLSLNDNAADVMDAYFERVSHAAMTDVSVDWAGLQATDIYPQRLPDLIVGRPIVLTGRFEGQPPSSVRVVGRAGGREMSVSVPVQLGGGLEAHPGLAAVWARCKIADCTFRSFTEPNGEWNSLIKQVALEFGLMSDFTAFVAVDSSRRTDGDHGTTVPVPVPVPDGVRYETTVSAGSEEVVGP